MTVHTYITKLNKADYLTNLEKLLNYHHIHYSIPELNSYNRKELKYLNYIYRTPLVSFTNESNKWYITNSIY